MLKKQRPPLFIYNMHIKMLNYSSTLLNQSAASAYYLVSFAVSLGRLQ